MVYVVHGRRGHQRGSVEDLWQRLRVLAAERKTSISKLVVEASEIYLDFIGRETRLSKAEDCVVEAEDYLE